MAIIISVVPNHSSACTVIVLPITSAESAKKHNKTEEFYLVPIEASKPSFVCCNQMKPIVTTDLRGFVGSEKMLEIDKVICKYLCLTQVEKQDAIVLSEIEKMTYEHIVDSLARDACSTAKTGNDTKITNDVKKRINNEVKPKKTKRNKVNCKYTYICEETGERFNSLYEMQERFKVHFTTFSKYFSESDKIYVPKLDKYFCRRLLQDYEK